MHNKPVKVYLRIYKKGIPLNKLLRLLPLYILILSAQLQAQHLNKMTVEADVDQRVLKVKQEITFVNQTGDTLTSITLNDWNNAYSSKTTPLAKRFSDEYVRAFHIADDKDRGGTTVTSATANGQPLKWSRPEAHPDIIDIEVNIPIYPNGKFIMLFEYEVKLPDDRFTRYGVDDDGNFILKNWYLTPARYEAHSFVKYSNENLDDIANAVSDYEVTLSVPSGSGVTSDLYVGNKITEGTTDKYFLIGESRLDFNLMLERKSTFEVYRNAIAEVSTNLKDKRLTDIQKALLIDEIVKFTSASLGSYPQGKVMVTQVEYERNPVYGLNQLPAWISPFPDTFLFEIKFLKTYLGTYLKNTLRLDPRKDSYIYNGIQSYLMMKYVEQNHPDKKMMGLEWGILKGHNLFKVDFNGQYNYLYLLMARSNLDQPVGDARNTFIKFNEQIAGRYRSGLSFAYLDDYLGNSVVPDAMAKFYELNKTRQTNRSDFENLLTNASGKDLGWFFDTVIGTRDLIDYKITGVKKDDSMLEVTVKNRTGTTVPVALYGLNKGEVVSKQYLENIKTDSTFVMPRASTDKLVLNYSNSIPEYNARNNWYSLNRFLFNRPLKFTFFQDLEDPRYNQVFYVPSFVYNLYDGVSIGLRFHNKSLLEKPFIFDIEPTYSSNTKTLIGSASFLVNQYVRDGGSLYNVRYSVGGSTYHYAPDAAYIKLTPAISFRFRDEDIRKNKKQNLLFRYVMVDRESSVYAATTQQNENYSIFNARYSSYEAEITRQFSYLTDVQLASNFGKLSGEFQFRRLFNDNRQINLRIYAGMFMYRSTNSDFFSFGVDRPNDYMFDYNLYGRSETSGLFSQQYVMAEGGFKSVLDTRLANQWLTTVNGSFNIWNWIEVYGDAGLVKNKYNPAKFIYDSGIRLNLVPDYFELYLPVYSSNGFELNDANYIEKIRFVVTISPSTLINLVKRKWL